MFKRIGEENNLYIILKKTDQHYSDGKVLYLCKCKECGGEHLRTYSSFKKQHRTNECPQYRGSRWMGLEKRDYILNKLYGILEEDFNRMLEEQDNSCKICRKHKDDNTGRLHVDHCHDTGKVRGLLCSNCNTALGLFKDSTEVMREAIKYLEDLNGV